MIKAKQLCKTCSFSNWWWFIRPRSFLHSKNCFLFILYEWWRIYQLKINVLGEFSCKVSRLNSWQNNFGKSYYQLFIEICHILRRYCFSSRSSHQMCLEKVILKYFTIFTGKHLCWTLKPANLLKRDSNTGVFYAK